MQSNLSAFLDFESQSSLWCSWNAPFCNASNDEHLNALVKSAEGNGDRIWNIVRNRSSKLVALIDSANGLYIQVENENRVPVFKPRSKLTFGRIECIQNENYVWVGEENGAIHLFQCNIHSDIFLVARCESLFHNAIQFILPLRQDSRKAIPSPLHAWVLSEGQITLVGGLPPSPSGVLSSSSSCIDLKRVITFSTSPAAGTLLRCQVRSLLLCSVVL